VIYTHTDIRLNKKISTAAVLHILGAEYKVIVVGDAYMAPEELLDPGGAVYYYHHNDTPGIERLRRVQAHFRACIWFNPILERH
jgi:uncharacterized protein with von Willebrand factor type A (vWA) domain